MIEKRVPKDIRKYKRRTFGPLTTRQAICFFGAGISVIAGYLLVLEPLHFENHYALFLGAALFASPCVFLGFVEPMGIPFEKWILIFIRFIIAKPNRVENTIYRTKQEIPKTKKRKKTIKKELEEHPEYRRYE